MLGRCLVNHQLHKMGKHPTGLCDQCNVPETVTHFLLECKSNLAQAIQSYAATSTCSTIADLLQDRKVQDIIISLTKRRL